MTRFPLLLAAAAAMVAAAAADEDDRRELRGKGGETKEAIWAPKKLNNLFFGSIITTQLI